MTIPLDDLTSAFLDAGTDDPSQARPELLAALLKQQDMLANMLESRQGCLVRNTSSGVSVPNGVTTDVTWADEDYDQDNYHAAGNSERITITATDIVRARVHANVVLTFPAASASSILMLLVYNQGSDVIISNLTYTVPAGATDARMYLSSPAIDVASSGYFRVRINQLTGASATVPADGGGLVSWFELQRIEV